MRMRLSPLPRSRPRSRAVAGALLLAACGGEPAPASRPATDTPAPPGVPSVEQLVDSALTAFRRDLPEVARLTGGASSRDALVQRFVQAGAARDTGALRDLLVTRAEFAWLYFPQARLARPPYGIDPGYLWLQMASNTDRDLPKALQRLPAGATAAGVACADSVVVEGPNRLHEGCLAIVARGGRRDTLSLFGSILERDGRFKLLSFANRL